MDAARAEGLLRLAEHAEGQASGPDADGWLAQLSSRADELSEAIRWFGQSGCVAEGLRLAGALRVHWQDSGRVDEGRTLLEDLLGQGTNDGTAFAKGALTAGVLAFRQGDQDGAHAWSEHALGAATEIGDPILAAQAQINLSRVAFRAGDPERIRQHARAAAELAPGDRTIERNVEHMLGWAAHTAGDPDTARAHLRNSLEIFREQGDQLGVAMELANIADIDRDTGDVAGSLVTLQDALRTAHAATSHYLVPSLLASIAFSAERLGHAAGAARLLAASEAVYGRAGVTPDPGGEDEWAQTVARLKADLGARYDDEVAAGAALSMDDAVAEALALR